MTNDQRSGQLKLKKDDSPMPNEENTTAKPEISEFKGNPVLRIPVVDNPDPAINWHWMSFGKNKAKAIVKWIDEIKKFAEG